MMVHSDVSDNGIDHRVDRHHRHQVADANVARRTERFAWASATSKTRQRESFSWGCFAQKISIHRASTLEFNRSSRIEGKSSLQSFEHRFADVSPTGRALRFKPACRVHRITPDVVNELADANDAGNDAPGLQSDAQTEAAELAIQLADVFVHRQGHSGHSGEMIRILLDQATGDHVAVANGLDLFQLVVVGEFIKPGENTVQRLN